ncbi:MAG: DUF4268 domain-containing protein [Planctomycetes bacterium]|nr:DUF4268 domain-containing protein [Planctomycetota bacterium]
MELGNLNKFDKIRLREIWGNEASDFTPWLAEEENMALLSNEIGIEIEDAITEYSVGPFKVDIYAKETNTDKNIIIENQLDETDHKHLGQLITYAAGLEASFVIWIVRDARDEHRQAIDWLNEHTNENLNFFLIEIQLWEIDNSKPAVKFEAISLPNEWTKSVRTSAKDGRLTETKIKQQEFWRQFIEFGQAKDTEEVLYFGDPMPKNHHTVAFLGGGNRVPLTVDIRGNKVGCELYIGNSKEWFSPLYDKKEEIEKELDLSQSIDWQELPGKKASRIKAEIPFKLEDESTWEEAFEWLVETSVKFVKVFSNNLRKISYSFYNEWKSTPTVE